jgi:hypothetical protein
MFELNRTRDLLRNWLVLSPLNCAQWNVYGKNEGGKINMIVIQIHVMQIPAGGHLCN